MGHQVLCLWPSLGDFCEHGNFGAWGQRWGMTSGLAWAPTACQSSCEVAGHLLCSHQNCHLGALGWSLLVPRAAEASLLWLHALFPAPSRPAATRPCAGAASSPGGLQLASWWGTPGPVGGHCGSAPHACGDGLLRGSSRLLPCASPWGLVPGQEGATPAPRARPGQGGSQLWLGRLCPAVEAGEAQAPTSQSFPPTGGPGGRGRCGACASPPLLSFRGDSFSPSLSSCG